MVMKNPEIKINVPAFRYTDPPWAEDRSTYIQWKNPPAPGKQTPDGKRRWGSGVRQLAAAFLLRACSPEYRAPVHGQQAGLSESGSKLPHSRALHPLSRTVAVWRVYHRQHTSQVELRHRGHPLGDLTRNENSRTPA
jgi:hypothetical protein